MTEALVALLTAPFVLLLVALASAAVAYVSWRDRQDRRAAEAAERDRVLTAARRRLEDRR